MLDPFKTGELLEQAKVPAGFGTTGRVHAGHHGSCLRRSCFSIRSCGAGAACLGSALIVFFLGWIGYYYSALVGKECSCFPLIKRSIGPGFFISDGVMLLLGLAAFPWSAKVLSAKLPFDGVGNAHCGVGWLELWCE